MKKYILIIVAILLITGISFAGIRMISQGPLSIGSGGIQFSKSSSASASDGTFTFKDTGGIAFKDTGGIAYKDY